MPLLIRFGWCQKMTGLKRIRYSLLRTKSISDSRNAFPFNSLPYCINNFIKVLYSFKPSFPQGKPWQKLPRQFRTPQDMTKQSEKERKEKHQSNYCKWLGIPGRTHERGLWPGPSPESSPTHNYCHLAMELSFVHKPARQFWILIGGFLVFTVLPIVHGA